MFGLPFVGFELLSLEHALILHLDAGVLATKQLLYLFLLGVFLSKSRQTLLTVCGCEGFRV